MSSVRQVTAREVVRVATRLGFVLKRQKGSHAVYKRESDNKRVVIPMHGSRSLRPGTLHSILKDMGVSADEFQKLR